MGRLGSQKSENFLSQCCALHAAFYLMDRLDSVELSLSYHIMMSPFGFCLQIIYFFLIEILLSFKQAVDLCAMWQSVKMVLMSIKRFLDLLKTCGNIKKIAISS